jgi:hypothetical protein
MADPHQNRYLQLPLLLPALMLRSYACLACITCNAVSLLGCTLCASGHSKEL